MQEYKISRIQVSSDPPTELAITWFAAKRPEFWGTKSAEVQTTIADKPQCVSSGFDFPANTSAERIEVRSKQKLNRLIVSFSDKVWDQEGECPAEQLCPKLDAAMRRCASKCDRASCDEFVEAIRPLTSNYQCRRAFDSEPVPALWRYDVILRSEEPSTLKNTFYLLRKLKSKKAKNSTIRPSSEAS